MHKPGIMQTSRGCAPPDAGNQARPPRCLLCLLGPIPERRDRDSQESLSWWLVPGWCRREPWLSEAEWGPATNRSSPWALAAWLGGFRLVWSITQSTATPSRPQCQWPCPGGTPGRGPGSRRLTTATSTSSPTSQLPPGQSGCPRWISSSTASSTSRSYRPWWEPPRTTETTLLKNPVILITKAPTLCQPTPLLSFALKIIQNKRLQWTPATWFRLRPASRCLCPPPHPSSPRAAHQATSHCFPPLPPPYLRPCHTRHTVLTVFLTILMMTYLMLLLSGKTHEM